MGSWLPVTPPGPFRPPGPHGPLRVNALLWKQLASLHSSPGCTKILPLKCGEKRRRVKPGGEPNPERGQLPTRLSWGVCGGGTKLPAFLVTHRRVESPHRFHSLQQGCGWLPPCVCVCVCVCLCLKSLQKKFPPKRGG